MSENKNEVAVANNTQVIEVANANTELANPFKSTAGFQEMFDMAKMLASSDMVPQGYQGKPMNCLIAMEQAQRMNVSPLMVMQNLYIVKGKPSWSGSACSAIIQGCGLFENVNLNYVGKEGEDSYGAYVSAVRKSDKQEIKGTVITMEMAKAEGWTNNSKWRSMKTQMLGYRAYSFFARLYCPNALSGFATEGEAEDAECKSNREVDNPFQ